LWIIAALLLLYIAAVFGRAAYHTRRSGALKDRALLFEREYTVGRPGAPPRTLFVLGDSFPMGYGSDDVTGTIPYYIADFLAERGSYVCVRNLSRSGARMGDLPAQIPALNAAADDLVVIFAGGMDTTHLTPVPRYTAQLSCLVESLQQLSCRQILVSGSPDMSRGPAFPLALKWLFKSRCRRENDVVRSLLQSTESSAITHVNVYQDGRLDREHYSADGDHPNAAGYKVWSEVFIKSIRL
jgi:lysophospholipase L1-like esterase